MPAEGVHASVKAIQDMEAACARFARALSERLPEIEGEIRRVTEALDDRRKQLRREVAELRETIASAREDDDVGRERHQLEEAEERLASVDRQTRRLETTVESYVRAARGAKSITEKDAPAMSHSLSASANDLKSYLAAEIASGGGALANDSRKGAATGVDMTSAERQALRAYTGTGFRDINTELRRNGNDSVALRKADLVSAALAKLPKYNGTVHRVTWVEPYIARYIPGEIVEEKGFTSTSRSERPVFKGDVFFTIHSKNGRDVADYSEHSVEEEVLMDKGTKFKVLAREEIQGIVHIEMEEI